jgi:choice-of-anchor B domain-containing protein
MKIKHTLIIPQLLLMLLSGSLFAQLNVELIGSAQAASEPRYSDVWGYVDSTGREYALVGGYNNTLVYDLIDPANPQLISSIAGPSSIWRDIKVHDTYAYVTTEGTGNRTGLQIIDLSNLPASASHVKSVTTNFTSAHNIYIDNGFAYVIGTGGSGGMHILDLSDPENPVQTGYYSASGYIHDVYVWNDTVVACAADSYDLVDVTDKSNPILISESAELPGIYAHQGWMTEDKRYFIAGDEFNVRDITVWDLQDKTTWNLVLPSWQMPTNSTVHNIFIKDNYAHISYYGDGYVILNIADPLNPFVAGQYDTYPGGSSGYNGAWGCYPYLPSGNTLISDIQTGLYVLKFNANDVPPVITNLFDQEFVLNGDDVVISGNIFDDNNLTDYKLYFRTKIDSLTSGWQQVSGTNGTNENEYEFTIPGQSHQTVVEYYFAAIDNLDQISTLPEGGSGTNPIGSVPPPELFSYQVIISGPPASNYYFPAGFDTTVVKGETVTFYADIVDTTGLPITKTWFRNGDGGTVRDSFKVNSIFGIAPRTDTIRVVGSNGFYSIERNWLMHVDSPTSVNNDLTVLSYSLEQNYPNPFNPATQIKFSLPEQDFVNLSIYNLLGQEVENIINEVRNAGNYSINFNAEKLTSGIYIAVIKTNNFSKSIKMTLLK